MMRRTPMKRTPWPRKSGTTPERAPEVETNQPLALIHCAQAAIKTIVRSTAKMARIGDFGTTPAIPKQDAVRSEPYRRLVATLPCIACGIHGYSQAAHPPPTGKGIKEDDRECFPLCKTRLLITGCHVEFDNYRLIPTERMREQAANWGARTRGFILGLGQWPIGLPLYESKPATGHTDTAQAAMN